MLLTTVTRALLVIKAWQHFLVISTPMCSLSTSLPRARHIDEVDIINKKTFREIFDGYSKSKKRLILLDHDGTIKPVCSSNAAEDYARVLRVLKALAGDFRNEVWIITASSLSGIKRLYGEIPNLNLAGRMGTQIRRATPIERKIELPHAEITKQLKCMATAISRNMGLGDPILLGDYSIKFEENSSKNEELKEMEHQLNKLIRERFVDYEGGCHYPDFGISSIELRHKRLHNKGALARLRLEETGPPFGFGMSIGDLKMDEDMHQEMRKKGLFAIVVKENDHQDIHHHLESQQISHQTPHGIDHTEDKHWETYASHRLKNFEKVITLLELLTSIKCSKGIFSKVKHLYD
ncbi:threalose-6-phosphate phosphatase [Puccinia graminis f. sp. tritici]|uniref:Threalose-6-phosphate phosphatase n=1 Tax=Puccinia graminis f. sp. tritici TaxID=56615 RepID=A0A5B0QDV4_PUCGR|nr:threalose-6-phosphate phosphatase [Puccinia graminis f. sp. tritici]